MKYIVIEIQTNQDGTVGNIVWDYDSRYEAESKYHSILASAALSSLPCHTAVLVQSDGMLLTADHYDH